MYKGHSQKDQKLVFKTNYRLMQVKSIAECSKGSILQYFPPSLSCQLLLSSLLCLFWGGCYTQVLLYLCKTTTLKKTKNWFSKPIITLCRSKVLQEHSVIISTFIKLSIVIKIFALSFLGWPFYAGVTVQPVNHSQT